MNNNKSVMLIAMVLLFLAACSDRESPQNSEADTVKAVNSVKSVPVAVEQSADVLIVGAGISGLSAAIEAAEKGLSVLVIDMASVFGGHAVVAAGVLNIPVTPDQQAKGIEDSHALAIKDFHTWGEDVNDPWVDYYVKHAREDIYDWVTGMGIHFFAIAQPAGNSVPRVHVPEGSGLNLITSIYRKALSYDKISMRWNTRGDELIVEHGKVVGLQTTNTRSGKQRDIYASAVIIATGGFQSNIQRVLDNWPVHLEEPSRILAGSGMYSQGSGLDLASAAGAQLDNLDYQWNYITGVPNPQFAEGVKGLSFFPFPGKPRYDIWVNDQGERFANECQSPKYTLPKVLAQPDQRYWSVFDSQNKPNMTISGPGWTEEKLEKDIYQNPDIAKVANSIEELAEKMGVAPKTLQQTVRTYNAHIVAGVDSAFNRFGPIKSEGADGNCQGGKALAAPPYYAVRLYPLSRKSMGGIQIDLGTHVLNQQGNPIPGLYAVGEATGFAGINGKAGLEGTFLGPSIVTGRVAGRTVGTEIAAQVTQISIAKDRFTIHPTAEGERGETECTVCHQLEQQIQQNHPGYEHFGFVHELVLEQGLPCQACHSNLYPYNPAKHEWDEQMKTYACVVCHGGGD